MCFQQYNIIQNLPCGSNLYIPHTVRGDFKKATRFEDDSDAVCVIFTMAMVLTGKFPVIQYHIKPHHWESAGLIFHDFFTAMSQPRRLG